ncbi:hypothetical protein BaRGS_00023551 [Batillaria attramentaria]|uniref:Uncharacterized protein n=1 Tax=Batillaria attramentaria TaxID=370345 RepID=A0ABD0KDE1_9CAEN
MGNESAKQAAREQVKRAEAEAAAKGEREGRQIMEKCYADLKRQVEAAQRAQGESQEWMKSTMETFLASQADMKQQYKSLMQEMASREERNAEERRNAERRHDKHMEMMKEDRERERERQEETMKEVLHDKEKQMERIQEHNEAVLQREKESHEEQVNRLEQNFSHQVDMMKDDKDKIEKRHEGQVQTLKGEMDKERSRMDKTLSDKEKAMQDERERTERDMKAKEQRMDKNKEEVKEMLEKKLDDTVNTMTEERERLEKKNEERVMSMKEDAERERSQHKEQEEFLKNEKIKSDESFERRIEAQTQQSKEYMEKMMKLHGDQMQLTWQTHMQDKQLTTNTFNTVLQGILDDKGKDRDATERREQRMLEWISERDKRHDHMVGSFMERDMMKDRQLQYHQQPQMIGYHQYPRDYPRDYSRGGYHTLPEPRFPALTGGPHGEDQRDRSFGRASGYGYPTRPQGPDMYDRPGMRSYDQEYMRRQGSEYGGMQPAWRPGADMYQQGYQAYGQQPNPSKGPYYDVDRQPTRDPEFNRRADVYGMPPHMSYGSQPSHYPHDQGPMRPPETEYPPRREDPHDAGRPYSEPYGARSTDYRSPDEHRPESQEDFRPEAENRSSSGNGYDRLPPRESQNDRRGPDKETSPGGQTDGRPDAYVRDTPPHELQDYRPSPGYQAFLEESGHGNQDSSSPYDMPLSGQ